MITEAEFVILDHHNRMMADHNISASNFQKSLRFKDQKIVEMQKYISEIESMIIDVSKENRQLKNELMASWQDVECLEDTVKILSDKLKMLSVKTVC